MTSLTYTQHFNIWLYLSSTFIQRLSIYTTSLQQPHTPTNINNKPTLLQDGSFIHTFKIPSSQQTLIKRNSKPYKNYPKTKVGQNESRDLNTTPQNKKWGINEIWTFKINSLKRRVGYKRKLKSLKHIFKTRGGV